MAVIAKKLQPAKTAAIEETKKILGEYSDYIFVDYRGLTVEQITKLRDKLREKDATLKVFKNTFARVAFDELKNDSVAEFLSGPTAIAIVKGAWVENEVYDKAKIEALSKLPGKKQLIAMLISTINGPARKLAGTLQAYVEKLEKEGPAAAAPAKEEAAPAESAPASEAPADPAEE